MSYSSDINKASININYINSNIQRIMNSVNNLPKFLDTSAGTATASDLLNGKVAYVNNAEIIGTMEYLNEINSFNIRINNSENSLIFNGNNITNIGYVNKSTKFIMNIPNANIASAIQLTSNMIAEGSNIFGIEGTHSGGGNYQVKSVTITENNTFNYLPDSGYDAISNLSVEVNVPIENTTEYSELLELTNTILA